MRAKLSALPNASDVITAALVALTSIFIALSRANAFRRKVAARVRSFLPSKPPAEKEDDALEKGNAAGEGMTAPPWAEEARE